MMEPAFGQNDEEARRLARILTCISSELNFTIAMLMDIEHALMSHPGLQRVDPGVMANFQKFDMALQTIAAVRDTLATTAHKCDADWILDLQEIVGSMSLGDFAARLNGDLSTPPRSTGEDLDIFF